MKDDVTLINEVLEKIPNKYMAVIVASKRAKELNKGVRPLVKTDAVKPTTVALYEIAAGFVKPGPERIDKEAFIIEPETEETIQNPELIMDIIEEESEEIDEVELDDEDEDIDEEDADIDDDLEPSEDADIDDEDDEDEDNV
jgi:DNA-directed RNA polymerase subunit omega